MKMELTLAELVDIVVAYTRIKTNIELVIVEEKPEPKYKVDPKDIPWK